MVPGSYIKAGEGACVAHKTSLTCCTLRQMLHWTPHAAWQALCSAHAAFKPAYLAVPALSSRPKPVLRRSESSEPK
jgi:hypothetical protein